DVLVEVHVLSEDIAATIVVVAVFGAAEHVVGEGVVETGADGPAMQRVVVVDTRGIDADIGGCPATCRIEQRAVEGEAGAGADTAGEAGFSREAGRDIVFIPVVVQVAFNTGDEA